VIVNLTVQETKTVTSTCKISTPNSVFK